MEDAKAEIRILIDRDRHQEIYDAIRDLFSDLKRSKFGVWPKLFLKEIPILIKDCESTLCLMKVSFRGGNVTIEDQLQFMAVAQSLKEHIIKSTQGVYIHLKIEFGGLPLTTNNHILYPNDHIRAEDTRGD